MRIANRRYEATDEQRWFSPPPCRIDELAPTARPVPKSQPADGARMRVDRILPRGVSK